MEDKYETFDIFCTACGDKIDRIEVIVGPYAGQAVNSLVSMAKRIHKNQKNCFGKAWKQVKIGNKNEAM